MKEHIYYVQGTHCASCEILIEKSLLKLDEIKSAEVSADKGEVVIEYEGPHPPSVNKLNQIFKKDNYIFSEKPFSTNDVANEKSNYPMIFSITLILLIGFYLLKKFGFADLISVDSKSSLPVFFGFGLMAGISSCAALVGGLILSMSKQWSELYSEKHTFMQKLQPHIMFNIGRIVSYGLLGALLGAIGSKLQLSITFTSILIFAVSVMMIFMGLQMLGFKAFRKFQITMPKFVTRYAADETHFKGKYMPFIMGALTFFLPCGFTITAQGLALLSGNILQGGLIMLFFALGTLPMLLFIGISSVKASQKPHTSYVFLKVAGILVLFFALYNMNSQLNVLGFSSLSDFSTVKPNTQSQEEGLAPIENGKQILKMNASSSGYSPNYFKVRAGVPVRWEITDTGTSGCTNAIISKQLFDGEIDLTLNKTSVKEFTPTKTGKYKFSCWMGMVSGVIEVVDDKTASAGQLKASSSEFADSSIIPSGASGCGGDNGGGCGGGCSACGGL